MGTLLMVIFFAAHSAAAYADIQEYTDSGLFVVLNNFLEVFNERLNNPFNFEWNKFSPNWLLWSMFGWFITVAYISTSKKNTIAGKEHGTAKWGNVNDIKDLFAINILKEEIKKNIKTKFFITRHFVKRKVYKECEINGALLKNHYLRRLNNAEELRIENGTADKSFYKEEKRQITIKVKNMVRHAKLEAWTPLKLKEQHNNYIEVIRSRYHKKLLNKQEKDKCLKQAHKSYRKSLKQFYYGKGKKKALNNKYKNADQILTSSERISIYNNKLNNNILILGGSGSGKTRSFVIPNILQAHSSYVVTDPKGEILEKCGYFLTEFQGYDIRVLNLDNKAKSDGYNPFIYIHSDRDGYEERVLMLIETIIINTDGGEKRNASDPFWEKAERLFLQAIFFFTCDGFIMPERNMSTVLALIGMLQIKEEEDKYDSDLDYFAKIFEKEHGTDHIGVQQYKEFRSKASGKTAKSIVISAVARLAPFRTSAVRRLFSYDTMNLNMLGEKKMAIFVVVPPTDSTFNFVAGMLFTQMFQELQHCATEIHKHDGQKLPVPVRFILDEFANTCTIPNFVKILAYARSFGIGIIPILQSLEQIKNMYKDEWGVIIDNCNSTLFLGGINHMDTLEYISKRLGKGTYDKKTTGRTRSKQGSSSHNWDVVGRELLDAAEISKLPKDKCLLLISGRSPFYSKKYIYESHPNYGFTSDGNHTYSYEYIPYVIPDESKTMDIHKNEEIQQETTLLVPSENTNVVVDEIKLSIDYHSLLNHMGRVFKYLVPVPDDDFTVDDGEPLLSDQQNVELLNLLSDNEDDKAVDMIISGSANLEDELEGLRKTDIKITFDPVKVAIRMGRIARHLVPVPDEDLLVEDGEPKFSDEQVNTMIMEFDSDRVIFDDNSDLSDILTQTEELIGDAINTLIDELPAKDRDTILPRLDKESA